MPVFEQYGIRALFTTRQYDMAFEPTGCLPGRKDAKRLLGDSCRNMASPSQVHGDMIKIVKRNEGGKGAITRETAFQDTDALITKEKNLPLGILTADCLPVFIVNPSAQCIGLVHAGWKGMKLGIVEKTIKEMTCAYNAEPEEAIIAFGPSIRQCCYEVGSDFRQYFPDSVKNDKNKFYFDLIHSASGQLQACGVKEKNIYDCAICTSCFKDEFFSFRREKEAAGRSLSFMEIL
ncbi:MAG TPA: peptidoglycan editing factor PgeF, partial [Candidatus Omnitrophota bacterium]|nr:peptidoglycan editing factor PgeF [Candidatus Omnitrophota bacterium]